jgi:CubicO group peptidase (beta-lactamase class C family)
MKIGNLYLQEGSAEDEQLVSENWVRASIQSYKQTGIPRGPDYGYLWWLNSIDGHDVFYANGYGGQFILVVPNLNLVAVATCEWRGVGDQRAGENWMTIMNIIQNLIVPSAH